MDYSLEMNNVEQRISDFLFSVLAQSRIYKTDHLMMTFGNDFTFRLARRWFDNIDKLIYHTNSRSEYSAKFLGSSNKPVNILYSTPACYLYALNQLNTDLEWEIKYDDFMPYADEPGRFWTGYFTSRPALKLNIRHTGAYFQSVRQLAAFAQLLNSDATSTADALGTLEQAMAVAQHHDAVSGTEKQYVANDYAEKMSIGVHKCLGAIELSVKSIMQRNKLSQEVATTPKLIYCPLLNATECEPIENAGNSFTVLVYNPLARSVVSWLTLPLVDLRVKVVDVETRKPIDGDGVLTAQVYAEERLITERRSRANYRLVLPVELPPLGFKAFRVEKCPTASGEVSLRPLQTPLPSAFSIKNSRLGLKFDPAGNLIAVDNFESKVSMKIQQSFCFYKSRTDTNGFVKASGAYVFR